MMDAAKNGASSEFFRIEINSTPIDDARKEADLQRAEDELGFIERDIRKNYGISNS